MGEASSARNSACNAAKDSLYATQSRVVAKEFNRSSTIEGPVWGSQPFRRSRAIAKCLGC
jgi:hypothetical protein